MLPVPGVADEEEEVASEGKIGALVLEERDWWWVLLGRFDGRVETLAYVDGSVETGPRRERREEKSGSRVSRSIASLRAD